MKEKLAPSVKWWHVLTVFALLKLSLHLLTNGSWSFHRDSLLYLALGRHLDWGYASVPPSIAAFAWFGTHVMGGSVEAISFLSSLFATGTLVLTGLVAREMGGGRFSIFLVGIACLFSPAYLRPGLLFQPVVFDIFYWTLFSFLWVKYLHTQNPKLLRWLGVAFGLGLLNKYSVLFFAAGLLPGLVFTPCRRLLLGKEPYLAAGIALLLFSPNLYWQAAHGFPVATHMSELAKTQLVHVSLDGFLLDQVLSNLPALPLWLAGLFMLLFMEKGKPWRSLGWMYLTVLALLLAMKGKSYYTLGAYPVLIGAGAALLGTSLPARHWLRYGLVLLAVATGLPLLPVSLPIFGPEKIVHYFDGLAAVSGTDAARRWEDGQQYPLPQDYADMLGWEELAGIVGRTWQVLPDQATAYVYAENYGQAGAIEYFGRAYGVRQVVSFSDSYLYWCPDNRLNGLTAFIYVNSELGEDMPGFFEEIVKVGEVETPYAREKGAQVYLCRKPSPAFFQRIKEACAQEWGGE